MNDEPPLDIGYVKCDSCMDAGPDVDHPDCEGIDDDGPFCGCRCKGLEIYEGD